MFLPFHKFVQLNLNFVVLPQKYFQDFKVYSTMHSIIYANIKPGNQLHEY